MSRKRSASSAGGPAKKKVKVDLETDEIDANAAFTLNIERCQAYPNAEVLQNASGKPRKGSFEVTLGDKELYSKLDSHGPAKSRAALPDPLTFVTETVREALGGETGDKKAKKAAPAKKEKKVTTKPKASGKKDLSSLTVAELRTKLKAAGLPVSGRKADLIDRLASA